MNWIKVADRLPELNGEDSVDVLIYPQNALCEYGECFNCETYSVECACGCENDKCVCTDETPIGFFGTHYDVDEHGRDFPYEGVTHWTPFPEPPTDS